MDLDAVVDPDADAEHHFVASTTPDGLRTLLRFARLYPELAEVVTAVEYAQAHWTERIVVVRISAQWAELLRWCAERGWQVLRIPGAMQDPTRAGGMTGPVYLMYRPTITVQVQG